MEIQLDEVLVATTMRTPGDDFELAVGYCFTEGLLGEAAVRGCRYCATGPPVETDFNVVSVDTGGEAPTPTPRLTPTTSSCGLCGAESIAELAERLQPLVVDTPYPIDVLATLPGRVTDAQDLFATTGAVHAAAAADRDGTVLVVREDIGRHNAVDKVIGHLLGEGPAPPGRERALYVSGRASFEMVQKAWAGGFSAVVAVSAPSALAVEAARAANLTLAGFAREGRMNVYSPEIPEASALEA